MPVTLYRHIYNNTWKAHCGPRNIMRAKSIEYSQGFHGFHNASLKHVSMEVLKLHVHVEQSSGKQPLNIHMAYD